ncbi:hypothetical protein [Streptodolium elevatio]|uniref:GNAT family N-acetyltransferase n=1 Tax=Streptodolium elevatio TaxID=3157996 RepID=A0ABV3DQW9_9ACTN
MTDIRPATVRDAADVFAAIFDGDPCRTPHEELDRIGVSAACRAGEAVHNA